MKPCLQIIKHGYGFFLPDLRPLVWRLAASLNFDPIEPGDPQNRFLGNGRALRGVHIDELAPDAFGSMTGGSMAGGAGAATTSTGKNDAAESSTAVAVKRGSRSHLNTRFAASRFN